MILKWVLILDRPWRQRPYCEKESKTHQSHFVEEMVEKIRKKKRRRSKLMKKKKIYIRVMFLIL